MEEKLKKYKSMLKELKILGGISSLMQWDQETHMPVKNTPFRADQLAYISKTMHEKSISKEFIVLVNELYENRDKLDPIEKRSIEVQKKDLDKTIKLPTDFIEEITKTQSLSHESWLDAKKNNNFDRFKPLLQKMFDLTKKYAEYIDPSRPTYDVLLDSYEEGITGEDLNKTFSFLRDELKNLINKIEVKKSKEVYEKINFNKYKLQEFIKEMCTTIGFDFERGAMGEVHHPFESSLSPNDVRINMSYYHENFLASVTGCIHELGHGLYEQFINPKYNETTLDGGVSLGIHESQSRLLENMIGRSKAFWTFFKPKLDHYFPEAKNFSEDDIVNDLNVVEPTYIRIESDEVTYNMHILLRYEIETEILNGKIKLDDIPDLWNSKMKDLLGIVPEKISEGALQDVHWSLGSIAYFPTYTLGNLNAAQLWNKFISLNPNWEEEVARGNFSSYFNFFKKNIWEHGGFYKPMELMKQITGEETNAKYLIEYLKSKYIK